MTTLIVTVAASLVLCALTAWMAYVKGWVDAGYGSQYYKGTSVDLWHRVARFGQYYPSLLLLPIGIAVGHYAGLWPLIGCALPLPFSRALFRYGVWRSNPATYIRWYGQTRYRFFQALKG